MMQNNSRKFWLFVCRWLVFASVFVASENPLAIFAQNSSVEARVTGVSGAATISGNGRNGVRLVRGTTLVPGDEVDTRGGGRVVIDLTDGSQVVVLPNSRIVIGSYQNANSLKELLQITLGRIRVKINHFKGKPNPYRIKSPTASIAVRGTVFEISVEPLGETKVVVIEGAVEVASLRDPANPLIAEPGRNVIVRPNFTIDFFTAGAMTKEVGERDKQKQSNAANQTDDNNDNSQNAMNVYERSVENIVESGETALPSRFAAFPDAYLDSLENPAYADSFTTAEGHIYLVPSINGSRSAEEDLRERLGLRKPRPVDYGLVPEGAVFVPLKRFRAVVGGSFGYVRNGLQSLTVDENSALTTPPFPAGTEGFRTTTGATGGNLFNGSFIFARRFGKRDQTSVGFSIERLFSLGNLTEGISERDDSGLVLNEQIASRSAVNRTRFTVGVKHDFGSFRFGAFYRFGTSAGSNIDRFRFINGVIQPNNVSKSKGNTSEIGFRLRGAISRRLFYGAEATLLFGRTRENLLRSLIVDSTERDRATRATLGFGLGYVWRPRTILSFDAAGGLIRTNQRRTEDFTGNLLETEHVQSRFLSLHAAVQTDVWRNLFVSASILSLTQSRRADTSFFADRFGRILNTEGIFEADGRTTDFYTDIYSNYGVGWRFKPNFVFQYILTTDYGQSAPRHTFLLRYIFDFGRK
ncbi:MAG: FecR family protein [Actinomycetota bacterium]